MYWTEYVRLGQSVAVLTPNAPDSGTDAAAPNALAGDVVARNFDGWSAEVLADFRANAFNYDVGGQLLLEDDDIKVWEIRLGPGERFGAHRHVLDYFWTALTDGASVQHTDDGTTRRVDYRRGDTRRFTFGEGEYLLHDLCNAGSGELAFITVELKGSVGRTA
jgi:hypothetical protein